MKKSVHDNRSTRRTRAAIQNGLLGLMRHKSVGTIDCLKLARDFDARMDEAAQSAVQS